MSLRALRQASNSDVSAPRDDSLNTSPPSVKRRRRDSDTGDVGSRSGSQAPASCSGSQAPANLQDSAATSVFDTFLQTCSSKFLLKPVATPDFVTYVESLNLDTASRDKLRRCFENHENSSGLHKQCSNAESTVTMEDFCNCLVDSEVIDLIKKKLLSR